MARRKKSRTSRRAAPSPNVTRVRSPKTRLKPLFQLLTDLSTTAEQAMLTTPLPEDEAQRRLMRFDAAILLRASNALKAIRLVCEQAHWEFASASVRQLFELVINMEYLAKQSNREAEIFRYAKYGLLQTVQLQHLSLLYDQKTGRLIDTERLATLESMLEHTFPEFRKVNEKGNVSWPPSWSGHSARYLAERSTNPLRRDQYDWLFAAWSEQAHGAPSALLESLFPRALPAEPIVASDDVRIAETITVAITLFLELWKMLPHVPQVDATKRLEWMDRVVAEAQKHGATSSAPAMDFVDSADPP